MPDFLASLLGIEGIGWLILAGLAAGLVRGFTGFGSGLVFLPVAAQLLPPFGAILTMTVMDLFGPAPILRRAWAAVEKGDLGRLVLGCALVLPLGMWVLTRIAPEIFRIGVALLALAMLAVLSLGLRYRGRISRGMVGGIGGLAGLLGGMAGLPGPPVILFYMSRPLPVATIRATILLFLLAYDLLLMGYMAAMGRFMTEFLWLGLALSVPNMLGNWLGARLFRPEWEAAYRVAAYVLIATSALSALPVWR
ncbi:TSUP family transporter [Mameliella sediminis]|uniref:TSUP family transporter n=1 Tax=Mameliella sediminis TaxID=2836866 RepID=UPI001C47CD76|nr:TSUP family transporter [Mameliella sediminis]MBV7393725.1 sulfite exporter TauE/SafE family protein [Mameliella sediminis]